MEKLTPEEYMERWKNETAEKIKAKIPEKEKEDYCKNLKRFKPERVSCRFIHNCL